jgi:uncharacterized surface protein with fasciclin (FAS1) repeats
MKINQLVSKWPLFLALGAIVTFSSCEDDEQPVDNTITGAVVANANFSSLETAVVRANLAATLSGAGPFTVFAPDNAAFAAAGLTDAAINGTTPTALANILLYHTIGARIAAADVPAGPNAKVITASGDSIFVTRNANGVFVNGIPVAQANIDASNGIIHRIGTVLQPPVGTTVQTAIAVSGGDTGLDSLVVAVTTAGIAPVLNSNILTVFAPTNRAFRELLTALSLTRVSQIPLATLTAVLTYHVVPGRAFSSDLRAGSLGMFAGGNTTVALGTGATIRGNGNGGNASNIIRTNVVTRTGVVHVIDRVLLP